MNGVGGNHQPVNLAPVNNNTSTQNTQGTQGAFGRFKVSMSNAFKSFFSRLAASQPPGVAVHSRTITLPPAPAPGNATNTQTDNFANALGEAKNNPAAKESFKQVHKHMQEIQNIKQSIQQVRDGTKPAISKNRHALTLDMQVAKGRCKDEINKFNKTVGADLKINFDDLEMALSNEAQRQSGMEYPEFEQEQQTYNNYNAMKDAWLN